jgi:hypothetical protein
VSFGQYSRIIRMNLPLADVAQLVANLSPKWHLSDNISRVFRSEDGLGAM